MTGALRWHEAVESVGDLLPAPYAEDGDARFVNSESAAFVYDARTSRWFQLSSAPGEEDMSVLDHVDLTATERVDLELRGVPVAVLTEKGKPVFKAPWWARRLLGHEQRWTNEVRWPVVWQRLNAEPETVRALAALFESACMGETQEDRVLPFVVSLESSS
jgi:hypothetical protein